MTSESPRPNWDGIVAPIIEVKLGEARVAQAKAEEKTRLLIDQGHQELIAAQQYQAGLDQAIARRWGLLESLHARELLESLNASQNVWRGLGAIEKQQLAPQYSSNEASVELFLRMSYTRWGGRWVDGSNGTLDSMGTKTWETCPVGEITHTKIGITPAHIYGKEEERGQQGIYLENILVFLKGSKYFDGDVLYVIDSDVGLGPVEEANTFNVGRTDTIDSEYFRSQGVFLIEAEHPQAADILAEVLKRSCIYRAKGNLLPFQLREKGEQILREAGVKPIQKPKGFWGRLFG